MFEGARPIKEFYEEQRQKYGRYWFDANKQLTEVKTVMFEYGNWMLFKDENGNLWEEYFSIGD